MFFEKGSNINIFSTLHVQLVLSSFPSCAFSSHFVRSAEKVRTTKHLISGEERKNASGKHRINKTGRKLLRDDGQLPPSSPYPFSRQAARVVVTSPF